MTEILIDAFVKYVDPQDSLENYVRTREQLAAAKGQIELLNKQMKEAEREKAKLSKTVEKLQLSIFVPAEKAAEKEILPPKPVFVRNTEKFCKKCSKPSGKRSFCSDECYDEWRVKKRQESQQANSSAEPGDYLPAGPESMRSRT